jgi:2-hydroxy-3-keto-5-methylthiopentenyl-1-phosphate phosphatase
MRTFLNRLRDRGWRNVSVRGYTDKDYQVLRRINKSIVCVEHINVDVTVDIRPQIDELFKNLIEIVERSKSEKIILPGGGDIPIPDFFKEYCRLNYLQIEIISVESIISVLNNFEL